METEVEPPSTATLRKYGLTPETWLAQLASQGGVCGVCGKVPNPSPSTGKRRMVIDHEHVPRWSRMPPEERVLYVRGLTCWFCNSTYLGRGMTIAKAEGVVRYLRLYAARRPK